MTATDRQGFGHDTTTDEVLDGIDLDGTTAPELDGRGGVYLEDCDVAEVDDESTTGGVRSDAVDPAAAERLWSMSEEMVGQTFDLA